MSNITCPIHGHDCYVTYYNQFPCYDCEQEAECPDCLALRERAVNITNKAETEEVTVMKCQCKFNNGKNHDVRASELVTVMNNGSVCYHPMHLPEHYTGGNWTERQIHVCKRHLNDLLAGRAVNITNNVPKEDTLSITSDPNSPFSLENFLAADNTDQEEYYQHLLEASRRHNIEVMEGNLYVEMLLSNGRHVLIEACSELHYECQANINELVDLWRQDDCCYDDDLCEKFSHILCLEHTPNTNQVPKEETTVKTNNKQIHCGYCHEYHDTPDDIAKCGGKTRVAGAELRKNTPFFVTFKTPEGAWMGKFWLPNKTMAVECQKHFDVKFFYQARNRHGFWVYVTPQVAKDKGDFANLITAYKANKKS